MRLTLESLSRMSRPPERPAHGHLRHRAADRYGAAAPLRVRASLHRLPRSDRARSAPRRRQRATGAPGRCSTACSSPWRRSTNWTVPARKTVRLEAIAERTTRCRSWSRIPAPAFPFPARAFDPFVPEPASGESTEPRPQHVRHHPSRKQWPRLGHQLRTPRRRHPPRTPGRLSAASLGLDKPRSSRASNARQSRGTCNFPFRAQQFLLASVTLLCAEPILAASRTHLSSSLITSAQTAANPTQSAP